MQSSTSNIDTVEKVDQGIYESDADSSDSENPPVLAKDENVSPSLLNLKKEEISSNTEKKIKGFDDESSVASSIDYLTRKNMQEFMDDDTLEVPNVEKEEVSSVVDTPQIAKENVAPSSIGSTPKEINRKLFGDAATAST